jgi:hypothetical protein
MVGGVVGLGQIRTHMYIHVRHMMWRKSRSGSWRDLFRLVWGGRAIQLEKQHATV